MRSDIMKRLQKLRVMAERGTTNEAANARNLFDALLAKYNIDEAEIEERGMHIVKVPHDAKRHATHLCQSLGIKTFAYKNMRHSPLLVESTEMELSIINDALPQIVKVLKHQKKQAKIAVDSYMFGWMGATYPVKEEDPKCPMCERPLLYDEEDRRYRCGFCKYKGHKLRVRHLSAEDVAAGRGDSGRLLESKAS